MRGHGTETPNTKPAAPIFGDASRLGTQPICFSEGPSSGGQLYNPTHDTLVFTTFMR